MAKMSDTVDLDTYRLKRFEWHFHQQITANMLHSLGGKQEFESYVDNVTRNLVFKMHQFWWGDERTSVTIKYPLNWWEAFKDRWFPRWLLKRYPVIQKVEVIDAHYVYPNIQPDLLMERSELVLVRQHPVEVPMSLEEGELIL